MYKQNEFKGIQLQKNDSLTSTGWLVWLLCIALSLGGTLAFFAWAKGDLSWQVPNVNSLTNDNY